MRSGFSPPSTLKQVEDILLIDRYSIPPENILNLYKLFLERYNLHYRQMLVKLRINVYLSQFFPLFCTLPVDHRPKELLCKSNHLRNYWRSKNGADFEDEERHFILHFKAIHHNFSSFHISSKALNSATSENTTQ